MKKENLLASWKEIASYLDRNISTCRRWEKTHGLPVYRIDEKSKSSVFAYKDEIDKWLEDKLNKVAHQRNYLSKIKWQKSLYFIGPTIAVLTILFFIVLPYDPQPADFKIQNSKLIILNENGKELWQYDTGIKNFIDENEYRSHFQIRRKNPNLPFDVLLPFLIIEDINQDGKREVLFCTHTQDRYGGGVLFCFNHKGDQLWDFKAGRKIKFGQRNYSSDFWIRGFLTDDLDNDGRHEIVLISNVVGFFPAQLVILDTEGEILGEYWNSGQFSDLALKDMNGDGRKEIIVATMNNEHGKASLIIFDSTSVNGSSPQNNPKYTCEELETGSQICYILFPRTEVDSIEHPQDNITEIDILDDDRIMVITKISTIIYIFNHDLRLEEARLSHTFKQKYKTYQLEGKIEKELNEEACRRDLMNGLLYYDGKNWTSQYAMSNPWNSPEK